MKKLNSQVLMAIIDDLSQKIRSGEELQWVDIWNALSLITEEENKGLHGLVCCFAANYKLQNGKLNECLDYLNESMRCIKGSDWEREMSVCYNMLGEVAHNRNNPVLAMEYFEKAHVSAEQNNYRLAHSGAVGRMAECYYRVGSYDHALLFYRECIGEMRRDGVHTLYRMNLYLRMLSGYGYCLIRQKQFQEALMVAEELKQHMDVIVHDGMIELGVYGFLGCCYHENNDPEQAEHYTELAMKAVLSQKKISGISDSMLRLLEYLSKSGQYHRLQDALDYVEPLIVTDQNEGFRLLSLIYRLEFCSEDMEWDEFVAYTDVFSELKEEYEYVENNHILRIINLRNKIRRIEEEHSIQVEKNNKLLYQADHDELSGLYNKRYMNRQMEEMFEEALEKKLSLGVIFLDIDYFKQLNDRYGHKKGDECIAAVADAIRTCMPGEFAARYGGDEFVLITLGHSNDYLRKCAQMLVNNVKDRRIANIDSEYTNIMTITIGIANAIPRKPNRIWDFLSAADEALYEQKEQQKGTFRFYKGHEGGL